MKCSRNDISFCCLSFRKRIFLSQLTAFHYRNIIIHIWNRKDCKLGFKPHWRLFAFLSCFVESFYFIRLEVISSRQECSCKGAAIAVPTRGGVGVTKVLSVWVSIWWCVVRYVNIMTPESRSTRGAAVCGVPVITILSCLSQFHRRPSWLVYQWKQESFRIISITTTGN